MAVAARVRDRVSEDRYDQDLVLRAKAWDAEAQVELHDKYRGEFFGLTRHRLRDKQWADVFADGAIEQVFEYLASYKPELSSFRTWAFRVARTSIIRQISDIGAERDEVLSFELLAEVMPALTSPEYDFVISRVHEEMENLEPVQQKSVDGAYFDGENDRELAEQNNIPQRRVCYRRKQALRQMKEGLSDVPFMSIRPETRFLVYNSIVAHDKIDSVRAQPGGEEGD